MVLLMFDRRMQWPAITSLRMQNELFVGVAVLEKLVRLGSALER